MAILARDDLTPWRAVETIAAAASHIEAWSPGRGTLRDAVRRAYEAPGRADGIAPDFRASVARASVAASSVPGGLRAPAFGEGPSGAWQQARRLLDEHAGAVRAWLAARLFGNWLAYSTPGLRTILEYLRVALSELEIAREHLKAGRFSIEPFRQADLLLVHLSDHRNLAARLAGAIRGGGFE